MAKIASATPTVISIVRAHAVLLILAAASYAAASPYRYQLHREPSLFVTSLAETREGLLWIASMEGLFRYDGFHFEKVTLPGLAVPKEVALTDDGTLWIGSEDGLFRLRDERPEQLSRQRCRQLVANGNVIFYRTNSGLERIVGSGAPVRLDIGQFGAPLRPVLPGALGDHFLVSDSGTQIFQIPREGTLVSRLIPGEWFSAVMDRTRSLWLENRYGRLYRLAEGAADPLPQSPRSSVELSYARLRSDPAGSAWFLDNPTLNLTEGYSLDRGREVHRHTHLAGGVRQNVWLAERQIGLVEYKREEPWEQWTSDRTDSRNFQLLKRANGEILIYGSRGLMRKVGGQLRPTLDGAPSLSHLLELPNGTRIALLPQAGVVRLNADGRVIQQFQHPLEHRENWNVFYKMTNRDAEGRVWLAADSHVFQLDLAGGAELKPKFVWPHEEEIGVQDIEIDAAGRPWIGHRRGLAYWENDHWVNIETDAPLGDVRRFELRGDEIWVARKNRAAFVRLRRNGPIWAVEEFRPDAGFAPDRTHWIRVDSRGWIWRAVDDGVRVSNGKNLQDWLYLREVNGLDVGQPSPQGFAEAHDGSIWIAGERGVVHLMPDAKWFDVPLNAPPPVISKLSVAGRHIQGKIGGLYMPQFREMPLEYRLLPLFEDWRGTKNGVLDFLDLRDNDYRLEVRYAGIGVSPVALRAIQVGRGAWRFPWTAVGSGLGALGLAWLLLRNTGPYRKLAYHLEKRVFLMRNHMRPELKPDLDSGSVVGERFEIGRLLARGGFSTVYEARDCETNDRVAVKVMGSGSPDESWVRNRFSHEQNSLRTIEHPHVVRLLDGGVGPDGLMYLVTPFLEGPSLRQQLQNGPLDPATAVSILRQLAGALEAAHRKGIVHLDFKPENVILTSSGAMLIDFGTSGLRGAEDELAVTKMLSGSAFYMAPERLTGHYSTASDLYAFGLVAQEMLTGKKLSDYRTPSFQAGFLREFAMALRPVAGENAVRLAESLSLAFEVEPRKRPAKLRQWVEHWVELLETN